MSATNRERAAKLRAAGLNYAEIACLFGVTRSTVWKWLNPERTREFNARSNADPARKAAKSEWVRTPKGRGTCERCGGLKGINTASHVLCRACWTLDVTEQRRARYSRIQSMWADGCSMSEIAAALGTTSGSLGVAMVRMRRDGWDLPYRYRVKNGLRVAA